MHVTQNHLIFFLQPTHSFFRFPRDTWNFPLTWNILLVPVSAAETRNPAGDDDHESDGDASDDEEKLQVDLAVAAGKPAAALARDLGAGVDDALPVAVAQVALRRGGWKGPVSGGKEQESGRGRSRKEIRTMMFDEEIIQKLWYHRIRCLRYKCSSNINYDSQEI